VDVTYNIKFSIFSLLDLYFYFSLSTTYYKCFIYRIKKW